MPANLPEQQKRHDWLRLARTARIGPVTFFELLRRFGDARAALKHLQRPEQIKRGINLISDIAVSAEIDAVEAYGAQLVYAWEPDYPKLLKQLAPPPPVLTVCGDLRLAQRASVALVGARQASVAGRTVARQLASALSAKGYVCVSGLARGIDGEVHVASLSGGTIAVLAGGIDHIYPPEHQDLYQHITEYGLIISENAFGYRGQARDFPRRNRLITGLSEGVVVIEAAERSGSLISARMAGEQGREVMAVPGSPLDPRSAGSNRLIRDGAVLVRDADDVLEVLHRLDGRRLDMPEPPEYSGEADHERIPQAQIESVLNLLSTTPMPIDEIAKSARLGAARCAAILVELELSGQAQTLAGGLAQRLYNA